MGCSDESYWGCLALGIEDVTLAQGGAFFETSKCRCLTRNRVNRLAAKQRDATRTSAKKFYIAANSAFDQDIWQSFKPISDTLKLEEA